MTVAEYAGTTEATSQLAESDPLSRVGATGSTGVGISAAPLVYDGKVFVGIAGVGYGLHPDQGLAVVGVSGQYGRPGLMAAFDAGTGRPLWHFDVTGPGWEGAVPRRDARRRASSSATWQPESERRASHADAWRYGGGSIYATPVVDTERKLLIFGTGNPSPQMADASRPGRQSVHLLARGAGSQDRQAGVALPAGAPRPLGLRRRRARRCCST